MSQRSIGLSVRRPAETLSGRQWFVSLGCAGGSALGLGLLMKSPWVAATTQALAIIPLWWTSSAEATFAHRLRFAVLADGLTSAIQLGVEVLRG